MIKIRRENDLSSAYRRSSAGNQLEEIKGLPQIIIIDISLGPENGLDFIPMLKKICEKRKNSSKDAIP